MCHINDPCNYHNSHMRMLGISGITMYSELCHISYSLDCGDSNWRTLRNEKAEWRINIL